MSAGPPAASMFALPYPDRTVPRPHPRCQRRDCRGLYPHLPHQHAERPAHLDQRQIDRSAFSIPNLDLRSVAAASCCSIADLQRWSAASVIAMLISHLNWGSQKHYRSAENQALCLLMFQSLQMPLEWLPKFDHLPGLVIAAVRVELN